MKTYEQTTNNILQRVEALQAAKVKRNRRILSVTTSLGCVAVITLLGNVIWLRGNHQAPPQPSESVVTNPNNDPAPQDAPVVDVPASKEESKVESNVESKVESKVESEPKKPVESQPKDEQPMDTPLVDEPDEDICIDEPSESNAFDSLTAFRSFIKNNTAKTEIQQSVLSGIHSNGYYYQPSMNNNPLELTSVILATDFVNYVYNNNEQSAELLDISVYFQNDPVYIEMYNRYKEEINNDTPNYGCTILNGIEYLHFFKASTHSPSFDTTIVIWKQNELYHTAYLTGHILSLEETIPLLHLEKIAIK